MLLAGVKPAGLYSPRELSRAQLAELRDAGLLIVELAADEYRESQPLAGQLQLQLEPEPHRLAYHFVASNRRNLRRLLHAWRKCDDAQIGRALGYSDADIACHRENVARLSQISAPDRAPELHQAPA